MLFLLGRVNVDKYIHCGGVYINIKSSAQNCTRDNLAEFLRENKGVSHEMGQNG